MRITEQLKKIENRLDIIEEIQDELVEKNEYEEEQLSNKNTILHSYRESVTSVLNLKREEGSSYMIYDSILKLCSENEITVWVIVNKRDQVRSAFNDMIQFLEERNIKHEDVFNSIIKLENWSYINLLSVDTENQWWILLDLSIVFEAQELDHEKYDRKILPMLSRTWWVSVYCEYTAKEILEGVKETFVIRED